MRIPAARQATLVAATLAVVSIDAQGFENKCTHPEMASNSARLLNAAVEGNYAELLNETHLQRLRTGADEEDGKNKIEEVVFVINHFYHGLEGTKLSVPGLNLLLDAANEDAVTRSECTSSAISGIFLA